MRALFFGNTTDLPRVKIADQLFAMSRRRKQKAERSIPGCKGRGSAVALLSAAGLLQACGGGSALTAPSPVAVPNPVPLLARAQDARTFVPPVEVQFAALDDTFASTDRWVGVLDGAAYRIEVPKNWNGELVVWARGYWFGVGLYIENPLMRRHLLQKGYAWAASSYTRNNYDVAVGVEDSNRLAAQFVRIAASNGGQLVAPRRTYIVGASMGGHVAAAAVEAEVVRDARNPMRYDGALSLCGTVADLEWYDYIAAYQLAMQQLLGFAAEAYPSQVYTQNKSVMQSQISDAVTRQDLSQPAVNKLYALMEHLSGGARPFYREGWFDPYHHNILFGLMNVQPTIDGILATKAIDTRSVRYRFNADLLPNADSRAFNESILRLAPDVNPNPLQTLGLRWVPVVAGQLTAPVMTLHAIGDLTVPINTQVRYRQRAASQGQAQLLVQRLIRDVGHCSFTNAEMVTAFDDLVLWVAQGKKAAGDDLTDTVRGFDATAGCAFTDNKTSADDRTDAGKRALAQAAYPTCPAR